MTPTISRKKRLYEEDAFQATLIQLIELRKVPGVVYWHTPNSSKLGGARTQRGIPLAAIRAKKLGLRAGVSDLTFVRPPDGRVFVLELKIKPNKPTPEQWRFMDDVSAAGGFSAWTDDFDRAVAILESWELIRYSRAQPGQRLATVAPVTGLTGSLS